MVIKVYVSGISASKEVKKRQQRVLLMLDSFNVNYETIDITEPGREDERATVQHSFKSRTEDKRTPLPPQFFNEDDYCGDYEDFNAAVDVDQLYVFLKLEEPKTTNGFNGIDVNEDAKDTRNGSRNNEIEGEKNEENLKEKQAEIEVNETSEEGQNETKILTEKSIDNSLAQIESSKEEEESKNVDGQEKQTEQLLEIPVSEEILEETVQQEPQEEEEETESEEGDEDESGETAVKNEDHKLIDAPKEEKQSAKVTGNEDGEEEEEEETESEEESEPDDVVHRPAVKKEEEKPSIKPTEIKQNTDEEEETEESDEEADD